MAVPDRAAAYLPVDDSVQTTFRFLCGWNFRETSGSTAVIRIRDGADDGDVAVSIALAANQSVGENYAREIRTDATDQFWYLDVVSGDVEGAVYGI